MNQDRVFDIPAICNTCSSVFPGFRVALAQAAQINLKGNKAGPCPVCGGIGNIIDGSFAVVGDTIRRLTDGLAVADILLLKAVVEKAQANSATVASVSRELEESPSLVSFAGWLKEYFTPKSGTDFIGYLGFLVSVIGLVLTLQQGNSVSKSLTEQEIVELTVKAVNASMSQSQAKAAQKQRTTAPSQVRKKVGRNDPCHCGSGRKHKRCCL